MQETQSINVACRFSPQDISLLDDISKVLERDRSYLIRKAVSEYIENLNWHIQETQQALQEADNGLFASEAEVEAFFDGTKRPVKRPVKKRTAKKRAKK